LFNEAHSDQHLFKCAEDHLPTAADNEFCGVFGGDGEACRDNGCRSLDNLAHLGRLTCEGPCNDGSAAKVPDGSSVPEALKDAVSMAKELAVAAFNAATVKAEAARTAETRAMENKEKLRKDAASASELLEKAQNEEQKQQEAKDRMDIAMAQAASTDAEMNQLSQESNAAVAKKSEKLALMNQALKAKQEKEAEWKMQEMIQKQKFQDMGQLIPKLKAQLEAEKRKVANLEQQIAEANSQWTEASQERSRIATLRKSGEGWDLRQSWKNIEREYKEEKDKVQALQEKAKKSEAANEDASSKGRAAVEAYLQQVDSYTTASEKKVKAKEQSDVAEAAKLQADFEYVVTRRDMAQALQDQADAVALTKQVTAVYKYAATFYDSLKNITKPEGGNEMMNIALLSSDPYTLPCLSSYNVVIKEANALAASNAVPILESLKAGLEQIRDYRKTTFRSWCGENGKKDVSEWIWGANGIEENKLMI